MYLSKTHVNIPNAGIVARTLSRNAAPGRTCRVKIYTREYSGANMRGIMVSATPNRENTLPVYK